MAVKQPKRPATPAERQLADRVARGRPPTHDPSGNVHERMAELADRYSCDVVALLDLHAEMAAARVYDGATAADADEAACGDVERVLAKRSVVN